MSNEESQQAAPDDSNTQNSSEVRPGNLYLVGTPIGNLGDLSPRVAAILADVNLIAAEDTRHTQRLLNHLGIRKRLESYHEHNRITKTPVLANLLQEGHSIALVSDAGMPCISDPGYELVSYCAELGIPVIAVPGPCAAIVGLSASGLTTDRFVFEGFLPAKGKTRHAKLSELMSEKSTIVLYEAPHRLRRTLEDMTSAGLGARKLTLARELTKWHEEYVRLTVDEAIGKYVEHQPRGEYVLILEGVTAYLQRCPEADSKHGSAGKTEPGINQTEQTVLDLLRFGRLAGLSMKDAVRACVSTTGQSRNGIYQKAVEIWGEM